MGRPRGIPASNRIELTGQRFSRLVVIRQAPSREHSGATFGYWLCRCDCGNEVEVLTSNLNQGNTKSCGCLNLDRVREVGEGHFNFKHGRNATDRTYATWSTMLRRVRYGPRYVERGISVNPRWLKFENFLADMGERPDGTTLDRIDNDGPYAPDNCRWATNITQGNNRANNKWVTHEGKTQTVAQWAREYSLSRGVLFNRLFILGWSTDLALKTPTRKHQR